MEPFIFPPVLFKILPEDLDFYLDLIKMKISPKRQTT